MIGNIKLLQTLNTKIFHDLSGTIGSIDTCLELMDNSDKNISHEAKNIVFEQASNLVSTIKFFKNVYGVSDDEHVMNVEFLIKTLENFLSAKKVKIQWQPQDSVVVLDSFLVKAVMCLAVVVVDASAAIKLIEFNISEDNGFHSILMRTSGVGIRINENLLNLANNGMTKINVHNCREHYISTILNNNNYLVKINKLSSFVEYNIIKQ